VTTEELAAIWPAEFPRPAEATNQQYTRCARIFAQRFPGRDVATITRLEAQQFGQRMPMVAKVIRTAFNDLLVVELVERNPFDLVRLRRPPGRRDITVLTDEEVDALEAAAPPMIAGMISFAAYTGVRLSEQLALRGCDISGDVATIEAQLSRRRARRVPLKSDSAYREVLIPGPALCRLPHGRGSRRLWPISHWAHFRAWDGTRRALGLERVEWHTLRHKCCTWYRDRGAETEHVRKLLGHVSDRLVRELYEHQSDEFVRDRLREIAT
jgi:integrase